MPTSTEIALAFNTNNQRKLWNARPSSKPEKGLDMVHFTTKTGMVNLSYNTCDGLWRVKFNKMHGAWGDYINAIAKSFYNILHTLKATGLPFEAPLTYVGVVIEATTGDDNSVYVKWQGQEPPFNPIMPELQARQEAMRFDGCFTDLNVPTGQ
jgi:hypothetical protein